MSHWESLDHVPEPESPEQADLALKLGMAFLTEMRKVEDFNRFSGMESAFEGYLRQPNGVLWHVHICKVPKA